MGKEAMRTIREGCLLAGVVAGLCSLIVLGQAFSSPALAAEWRFTPSMTVEGEHSDNFFRSSENKASVWVNQFAPAVELEGLTDRSRLSVNYKMGYYMHYGTRGTLDVSDQDYLGHNLAIFAATRPTSRLLTGIQEEYILTREPGASDTLSQIVTRDKYWRNRITPFASYDIAEKGEVKLSYRNEVLNYLETTGGGPREDSTENRGIVTFTYNLNSTNHIDLDNQFWHRDYSGGSSSYDSYQTQLVYRRELSSWLTGRVSAGYQWRTFDKNNIQDIDSPICLIGLTGATDRTKLDLSFEYGMVDFTQGDSYFTAYRTNAFLQRLFFDEVIRAYIGGYYQLSDYQGSPREDNEWNTTVGLGYSFWHKSMELSAEYGHTQRDSNIQGFGYTENVVYLRLTYKFDFPRK